MKLDRSKYLESRSLKPYTLLLAILGVNLLLGILITVFPSNGVSIGKQTLLKFVTFNELFNEQKPEPSAPISEILNGVSVSDNQEIAKLDSANIDSVKTRIKNVVKSSAYYDTATKKLTPPKARSLQLPPNNPNALKMLIAALQKESKDKVIRILHYAILSLKETGLPTT